MLNRLGKLLGNVLGGLLILVLSFFGTLKVIDYFSSNRPDAIRARHAAAITTALEKFRAARGSYPFPYSNNPISDLKSALVDPHFLTEIPTDPQFVEPENQYRYVSLNGKAYGLLLNIEPSSGKPGITKCLMGVGTEGTSWWGEPPTCRF